MNILLLTYQGDMAGATNSIFYLAKGLSERGHTVVVGCRRESLLNRLLLDRAPRVIRKEMTFRGKTNLKNMIEIRDAVRQYDIQIINAQSTIDRYTAIFANWLFRLNAIVVHTRRQKPRSDGGWLQRWFIVYATKSIITVSNQLRETLIKNGYPAGHVKAIFNGLPREHYENYDKEKVTELRRQLGIAESDIVVGCISRMKKQEQLVEAIPFLPPDVKILFVGIEQGRLDDVADQYGVKDRIIYAGKVLPAEVQNYYHLVTVNVLTTSMDGFGLTLLESMAAGVPVVATRVFGVIDVLDNEKNGLWYESGDSRQLAEKLMVALYDTQRRAQLIENGYKAAFETFSLDRTIDNYEQFFGELIDKYNA